MAHVKPDDIADLEKTLDQIRGLENLKEKGKGTFYYKSKPFLHFHVKGDHRFAHVKTKEGGWKELEIPFEPIAASRKKFLAAVQKQHLTFLKK